MPPRGLHAGGIESCGIRQLIVISECEPIEPERTEYFSQRLDRI